MSIHHACMHTFSYTGAVKIVETQKNYTTQNNEGLSSTYNLKIYKSFQNNLFCNSKAC